MTIELEDGTPPEWMKVLENKKRHHKLAHEVGAGAPCLNCKDSCLGLDLHFWRKICRNCKCKKEVHDVKEENSFEQFEILFGENLKCSDRVKKISLDLKCRLDDIYAVKETRNKDSNSYVKTADDLMFDWIPADVPVNLASEYLQQLPLEKLPITGSAGAMFRRQQLQKQMPLHDFKVNNCHDLTDEETRAFSEYLDNLKHNVVGKGQITKILPQCSNNAHDTNLAKEKERSSLSNNLNSVPKPFKCFSENKFGESEFHPLPDELLPPILELKTPSAFVLPHKIQPSKSFSRNVNNNQQYTDEKLNFEKYDNSNPVNRLTNDYSQKLQVDSKLDAENNNLTPSDIIRKFNVAQTAATDVNQRREAEVKYDVVKNPNKYCEKSFPCLGKSEMTVTNLNLPPLNRDPDYHQNITTVSSKNIDGKFLKLGNPEQFVAQSSEVSSKPQLSNTLTINTPTDKDRNQNPRVHFGSTLTPYINDESNQPHPHKFVLPGMPAASMINTNNMSLQNRKENSCHQCQLAVSPGQVVVVAERAGVEVLWHPQCFICVMCQELLVDLVYFFHKGEVYCGRDYAEIVKIPRCFACDELIFLNEYTVAEGQSFHVKHFCCFECDIPLAGKNYIAKDNNPICLPCYESKYGKQCHYCGKMIKAKDSRVGWKELSWHATEFCFKCVQCSKSLLGGKFVVRNSDPLCSKECIVKYDAANH